MEILVPGNLVVNKKGLEGEEAFIPEGCLIYFDEGAGLNVEGKLICEGSEENPIQLLTFEGTWEGVTFESTADLSGCNLEYTAIAFADIGLNLTGVTSSSPLTLSNCLIDSCGVGIYANNSRLNLTNSSVTRSHDATYSGAGVYLTTCSAGQVKIDNCVIADNGTDGSVYSAGVFMWDSDPEITRCEITGNTGSGVCAYSSSPDLNTYDFTGYSTRHNAYTRTAERSRPAPTARKSSSPGALPRS